MAQKDLQPQYDPVDATLARHGGLSYLEIPAVDARRSAAFYENAFGWSVSDGQTDHPKFADRTGHLIGRFVTSRQSSGSTGTASGTASDAAGATPSLAVSPSAPAPSTDRAGLLPYIYVDRINDALSHVVPCGGEIARATYCKGNLWVAIVRDPASNSIGLWQEIRE